MQSARTQVVAVTVVLANLPSSKWGLGFSVLDMAISVCMISIVAVIMTCHDGIIKGRPAKSNYFRRKHYLHHRYALPATIASETL